MTLFCPIRCQNVKALPEEIVRQRFLSYLMERKGYPRALISVEVSLKEMPHLSAKEKSTAPDRRADIICYAKGKGGLYPVLLIECKAIKLTDRVISQVLGYNHYVGAPYVAVVNDTEVCVGWFDPIKRDYVYSADIPNYPRFGSSRC